MDLPVWSEEKGRQVKYKGIHEPKGRVKNFRVEYRPPSSSKKLWVGTFDARDKAMRAFDAAVYLTGKEPHYFLYPEAYFPPRTPNIPKEEVKKLAKLFADRTDDLKMRPVSVHGDYLKTVESRKISKVGGERTNLNTSDAKTLDTPVSSEFWQSPAELDESLRRAKYVEIPNELPNSDSISFVFASSPKSKADFAPIQESMVDLGPIQEGEWDFEESAFQDPSSMPFMLGMDRDIPLHDCFALKPESFFYESELPPLNVASKRKRDVTEEACGVKSDRESMGFSENPAAFDSWLRTMFDNEPSHFTFFPRVRDSNPCSDDP